MMTETRNDRVARALNQGVPDTMTWSERCDPAWRAAFPCGIQPQFDYAETLIICTDQIMRAGAMLPDDDFEDLIDALVDWVFTSSVPYTFRESTDHIIGVLNDVRPEAATLLRRVAALNGYTLVEFLGAERTEFRNETTP